MSSPAVTGACLLIWLPSIISGGSVANLTDYVMVTSEDGTAYASSEYSTTYKADKAFGEDGYWCSVKSPERPVRLWFQFKEPKRVVRIKFEEQYEMSGEDGYEVFGSDAVGDCGDPNKQTVLTKDAASKFVTGKEFQNDQFFYCYGIQTNSYGRNDYVSAKKLYFKEWSGCGFKKFDYAECDEQTDRNWGCHEGTCWRSEPFKSNGWCYPTFVYKEQGAWTEQGKRKTCSDNDDSCLEIARHNEGDLFGENQKIDGCEWNGCGFEKFHYAECDNTTNRNWGCHEEYCWRSDTEKSSNWCYPTSRFMNGDGSWTTEAKKSCRGDLLPDDYCLEIAIHDIGKFISNGGGGGYRIEGCVAFDAGSDAGARISGRGRGRP